MGRGRKGIAGHKRYVGLDSKWHVAAKSIGSNLNSTIYSVCLGFLICKMR